LALQIAIVVFTQSRGPMLGVVADLAVFTLAWTALRGKRLVLLVVAAALALAIVLTAAFVPRIILGENSGIARLADFNLQSGSGRVRTLIWQAASDLILEKSSPGRLLI